MALEFRLAVARAVVHRIIDGLSTTDRNNTAVDSMIVFLLAQRVNLN